MTKKARRTSLARQSSSSPPAPISLGHLSDLVGYALRQTQLAVFRDFLRAFSRFNIRPVQYGILAVIERNPGLKQQHVCQAIGIRRANFVTLLDELEDRGLARRGSSTHDQRASALYLTDSGKTLMRELRLANQVHEDKIAAGLSREKRKLLIEMLNTIRSCADVSEE